jgi:hypothetical protein
MKIELENIEETLLQKKIDPVKVQEIIRDLVKAAKEEKEDQQANAVPKLKWEHVVILNDPDKKITEEMTAWVVKQKEGQDAGLILSKLHDAAINQNEASKRKKTLIKTFGELFESLKSKWTKEKGLKISTKEACRVLTVNGKSF